MKLNRPCTSVNDHENLKRDCTKLKSQLTQAMPGFMWEVKGPTRDISEHPEHKGTPRWSLRCIVDKTKRSRAKTLQKQGLITLGSRPLNTGQYQLILYTVDIDALVHYVHIEHLLELFKTHLSEIDWHVTSCPKPKYFSLIAQVDEVRLKMLTRYARTEAGKQLIHYGLSALPQQPDKTQTVSIMNIEERLFLDCAKVIEDEKQKEKEAKEKEREERLKNLENRTAKFENEQRETQETLQQVGHRLQAMEKEQTVFDGLLQLERKDRLAAIDTMRERQSQLEGLVSSLDGAIEQQKIHHDTLTKQLADYQQQSNELKKKINSQDPKSQQSREQYKTLQQHIDEEVNVIKTQLNTIKADQDKTQAQHTQLDRMERLQEETVRLSRLMEKRMEHLETHCADLKTSPIANKAAIADLQQHIEAIQTDYGQRFQHLEAQAHKQQAINEKLLTAVRDNDRKGVSKALQEGAEIHTQNHEALRLAAALDHREMAILLINSGAQPKAEDPWGVTAIKRAEEKGHDEIRQILDRAATSLWERVDVLSKKQTDLNQEQQRLVQDIQKIQTWQTSTDAQLKDQAVKQADLQLKLTNFDTDRQQLETHYANDLPALQALQRQIAPLVQRHQQKQQVLVMQQYLEKHKSSSITEYYNTFRRKAAELLLACKALDSGLIAADKNGLNGALMIVGEIIPFGGLILSTAAAVSEVKENKKIEKRMKRVSDFLMRVRDVDDIAEMLARKLTYRYYNQIKLMTKDGANTFAECGVHRLYRFMRGSEVSLDEEKIGMLDMLMQGLTLVNPVLKKSHKKVTLEMMNSDLHQGWNEAGVYQKTGAFMVTENEKQFYSMPVEYQLQAKKEKKKNKKTEKGKAKKQTPRYDLVKEQNKLKKARKKGQLTLYTRAEKYGYCLTTKAEVEKLPLHVDTQLAGPLVPADQEMEKAYKAGKHDNVSDDPTVIAIIEKAQQEQRKQFHEIPPYLTEALRLKRHSKVAPPQTTGVGLFPAPTKTAEFIAATQLPDSFRVMQEWHEQMQFCEEEFEGKFEDLSDSDSEEEDMTSLMVNLNISVHAI